MFSAFHMGHYSPLTWITLGADYVVWGLDPLGYHLTSLLLHSANAVVVYLIALRLLRVEAPGAMDRPLPLRCSAAFAALLFSIHPLRVESVAWATERRDVLFGLFYLLAVLVYLRPEPGAGARPAVRTRRYWACLLLFVAALLSKVMAVTLPAVLLLLDAYPLRRFPLTVAGLRSSEARRAVLEKLPFFALSAVASVGAFRATIAAEALTGTSKLGWVDRAAVTVYGLGFYLWKSAVPLGLAHFYALRTPFPVFAAPVLLSAVGVAALVLLCAWLWRRTPAYLMAFAVYATVLLPVIGIVHAGPQLVADRYAYLATLPLAVLLGAAHLGGWKSAPLVSRPRARLILLVVAPCLLLICLGLLTWRQVLVWHDNESLWANAVRYAPSADVHHVMGRQLVRQGRLAEAVPHLRRNVELVPENPWAHYDLALALERLDRLPEAVEQYALAVRGSPTSPLFRNHLGIALLKQGKADDAIAEFRRAAQLGGDSHEAHKNLGVALGRQGKDAEAIEQFEEALRLSPDFPEAHEGLGLAYMRRGDLPRAIREFRAALERSQDPAEARNNLGVALARQGDLEAAVREFRLAVELRPDFAAARRNLEAALHDVESRRRR